MFNDTFKSIEPNVVDGSLTVRTKRQGQDDMVVRIVGDEKHSRNVLTIEAPGGAQLEVTLVNGTLCVAVPKNSTEWFVGYELDDAAHELNYTVDTR